MLSLSVLHEVYRYILNVGMTPFLEIDALHPECKIPQSLKTEEELTLSIAPDAVRDLYFRGSTVSFVASMNQNIINFSIPSAGIIALFSEEDESLGIFSNESGDFYIRNGEDVIINNHKPDITVY